MKTMKKYLALLLAVVMALTLFACGDTNDTPVVDGEEQGDVLVLRYGNAAVASAASSENAQLFCKNVEEISGGKIKVEYIGDSALGDQTQHYAMIKEGSLDFMQSSFDSFVSLENGSDFAVVLAPYVFDDQDHLGKFVQSDLCKEMLAGVEEANNFHVVGICTYAPPRCLNTVKPISSVDECRGLRIRVPNSTAMLAIWQAWGAEPQIMGGSELYSAMENGLIDAQDNDLKNTFGNSFQEVAPYYTETEYIQQCYLMFCSASTWDKLTDEQKGWIEQANAKTCEEYTKTFFDGLETAREGFIAAGGTIVDCDIDSFKEAGHKFCEEQDGVLWSAGLYQKIRDLKNS